MSDKIREDLISLIGLMSIRETKLKELESFYYDSCLDVELSVVRGKLSELTSNIKSLRILVESTYGTKF